MVLNKGFLLNELEKIENFITYGVDLSPEDVEFSRKRLKKSEVHHVDAIVYLKGKGSFFDWIILKAVLEHVKE